MTGPFDNSGAHSATSPASPQVPLSIPPGSGESSGTSPGPLRAYNAPTPATVTGPQGAAGEPANSWQSYAPTSSNVDPNAGGLSAVTETPLDAAGTVPEVLSDAASVQGSEARRIFFRYDALYGVLSASNSGPIGSASAAGFFTSNGITAPFLNSLSDDVFGSPTEFGTRIEFGEVGEESGWLIGILDWDQSNTANAQGGTLQFNDPTGVLLGFQDSNSDNIDDDLDGDHIYGRSGVDLGTPDPNNPGAFLPIFDGTIDASAPSDTDDLVTWVPVFNSLSGTLHTDITGIELMRSWRRLAGGGRFGFDRHFMGGVRFIEFDENLSLLASGSFFDATSINSSIENSVIGPQIGSEFSRRNGPWSVGGTLKFLLGLNFQGGKQLSNYATNLSSQTQAANQPLNLAPGANSSVRHDTAFSPVFEWRLDSAYHLGTHATARIGYTGILFGGIARATKSVDYTLPTFGLALRDDAVVFNALTFGFDVVF